VPWPSRRRRALPAASATAADTVPATKVAAPTSRALAASTTPRRGTAANVGRTVPVLYSPLTTTAPNAANTICAGGAPVRLPPSTVSSGWRLPVRPTNTAITGVISAAARNVQRSDRVEVALTASAASARRSDDG